jgi:hypothetical protein
VKKITTLIILFFVVLGISAQKQKVNYLTTFDDKLIHFGFTLGLNTLDFSVVNYKIMADNSDFTPQNWQQDKKPIGYSSQVRSDIATLTPGFTVGIVSSLRLSQDLDLRFLPGLSFGERQLTYNIDVWDIYYNEASSFYSIKSTFLDFPLLIKYKARRINNDRPFLIFGGAYRQDISRSAKEDLVSLKRGGLYAELGAGWDHYFTFFRFSVEAKVSIGLNNQLGPPPSLTQRQYYSQSIKSLRSNIFTLAVHFE